MCNKFLKYLVKFWFSLIVQCACITERRLTFRSPSLKSSLSRHGVMMHTRKSCLFLISVEYAIYKVKRKLHFNWTINFCKYIYYEEVFYWTSIGARNVVAKVRCSHEIYTSCTLTCSSGTLKMAFNFFYQIDL